MAVGIMTARAQASPLSLILLSVFLQVLIQGQAVFQAPPTQDVFLRSKRANGFLLEEILQGNLERECYEEMCNYEEAREFFEDDALTNTFWARYYDGDHCQPNPCLHGGNCTDKVGGFLCTCPAPRHGPACELGGLEEAGQPPTAPLLKLADVSRCPTEGPDACHQLCTVSYDSFRCSCLPGFDLQRDGRTCLPKVEFPCGQLPRQLNTPASMCPRGRCPWQVSLTTSRGEELCSGVVLGRRSILTAASCLHLHAAQEALPRPADFLVLSDKMAAPVHALYVHNRYRRDRHDNDLALLELAVPLSFGPALIHLCLPTRDFCENILMQPGRTGMATDRGPGGAGELVYMSLDECRSQLNVSHLLSNKMFCVTTLRGPSGTRGGPETERGLREEQNRTQETQSRAGGTPGAGDHIIPKTLNPPPKEEGRSGSEVSQRRCDRRLTGTPVATVEQGTAFVTGLLMSSSAGCDSDSGGLVFTKLSRYLNWIQPRLETVENHMTPQVNVYPETPGLLKNSKVPKTVIINLQ